MFGPFDSTFASNPAPGAAPSRMVAAAMRTCLAWLTAVRAVGRRGRQSISVRRTKDPGARRPCTHHLAPPHHGRDRQPYQHQHSQQPRHPQCDRRSKRRQRGEPVHRGRCRCSYVVQNDVGGRGGWNGLRFLCFPHGCPLGATTRAAQLAVWAQARRGHLVFGGTIGAGNAHGHSWSRWTQHSRWTKHSGLAAGAAKRVAEQTYRSVAAWPNDKNAPSRVDSDHATT